MYKHQFAFCTVIANSKLAKQNGSKQKEKMSQQEEKKGEEGFGEGGFPYSRKRRNYVWCVRNYRPLAQEGGAREGSGCIEEGSKWGVENCMEKVDDNEILRGELNIMF